VTVPDPLPLIGKTTIMSREAAETESRARHFSRMYTRTMPYDDVSARRSAEEMAAIMAEADRRVPAGE